MAKEDIKAPVAEAPKAEAPVVYPEGSVEIGTAPGEVFISHEKKDGSKVILQVITH